MSLGSTSTNATVKVGDTYYRVYNDDTDSEVSTTYSLSVINKAGSKETLDDDDLLHIEESYYLSIFTKTNTTEDYVNRYNITSLSRLTGGDSPAKSSGTPGSADVLFGNLFTQTNVSYHANYDESNPDLIDNDNKTVKVKLESTIGLTATASNNFGTLIGGANIYQSFLVYLTRNDNSALTKAILGEPSAIASYEIKPVKNGSALDTLTGGNVSNGTDSQYAKVGGNYVEVTSGRNIASYLVDGGAKITAYVHITYDSQESRVAQFPGRTSTGDSSEQDKYAFVTASSNIGFDVNTIALSKSKKDATNASNTEMHYYIMSSTAPTLEYNAFADADGDIYGQLGINANDLDDNTGKVDVKTEAVYNISPIAGDVADYNFVKVTFDLKQKEQETYDSYDTPALEIRTYMKDVIIDSTSVSDKNPKVYSSGAYVTAGASATEYSFILPRSAVATNGDNNLLTIPISFSVFTGSDVTEGESASFEGKGLMYSNYKITVSCEMLENASDESTGYSASHVSQYIIYTNAKLIKDYISSGD